MRKEEIFPLMKKLMEKFHSSKGFTLIEMLIVVAIISILIAISIPVVNQSLERAREATDAANERSFKAELMVSYLMGTVDSNGFVTHDSPKYAYDARKGKLVLIESSDFNDIIPYGKGKSGIGQDDTAKEGRILYGGVTNEGDIVMGWGTLTNKGMSITKLTSDVLN